MNFLNRADIILYGDVTIRNYLNDLYDIGPSAATLAPRLGRSRLTTAGAFRRPQPRE
jgi:hypothetical protein